MRWKETLVLQFSVLAFAASAVAAPSGVVVTSTSGQSAPAKARTEIITDSDLLPVPNRGVPQNEAAVVDVCSSYVEAQMIYFRSPHDSTGILKFARKIRSTPGKHDGIYWANDSSDDESPLGPSFAAAAIAEDESGGESHPYFGYYFKILLSQGPGAPGGARNYEVGDQLISGFALIAWPAEYGTSGVHSFLVNHLGDVYSKDLGSGTYRVAFDMPAFELDRTWTKVASAMR